MLNNATIMGRLVRDPELRYTQQGTAVTSFTVAVDRDFKNANGDREADFINCVAWRQTAEFTRKWFQKGRMICVVGSIRTRRYADDDGKNRYVTELVADKLSFCGDRAKDDAPDGVLPPSAEFEDLPDDYDDGELPF